MINLRSFLCMLLNYISGDLYYYLINYTDVRKVFIVALGLRTNRLRIRQYAILT